MEYTVAGGAETQQNQPPSMQSAAPTSLYPSYVYDPQYALYYQQSQISNPNLQQQYDANGSLVHPPGVDPNQAVAYANASTYLDAQQLAYYYAAYPQAVVSGQDPNAAYYQDPNAAYYQDPNAAHLAYNPYSNNGAVMQQAAVVQRSSANPNSGFRAKRSMGNMGVRNTIPMKKRPKIPKVVQSSWCEVCKVDCNSKEVFDKHNLGRKHKKNVEKIIAASRPAPPPPPPPPPRPPPQVTDPQVKRKKGSKSTRSKKGGKRKAVDKEDLETKKKKMLEEGATVEGVRWCEVCNVVCNSETVFRYHLAGKNHAYMEKRHVIKMKRLALKTTNNNTATAATTTGTLTIAEPASGETTVTLTTNAEPASGETTVTLTTNAEPASGETVNLTTNAEAIANNNNLVDKED